MDNSNQFPGLWAQAGQASVTKRAFISFIVWERERWGSGRTQINYGCDYLVRSPDTSGLGTLTDYLLCLSIICINVCVSDGRAAQQQVFDVTWCSVAWCVTILTIRHIWAGPLIIVSSLLTYLSSETLDIDSDPVTMISHIHIIIMPLMSSSYVL